jgi:hypothetical protein
MLLNTNSLGSPADTRKKKSGKSKIKWTPEDTKRVLATAIVIILGTVGFGFMTFCGQVVLK